MTSHLPAGAPNRRRHPRSRTPDHLEQTISSIHLLSWEFRTDACIYETLRTAQPHTVVRRNIGAGFDLGPYHVPYGSYVAYLFSDTLLYPDLYPNPFRWDPLRRCQDDGAPSLLCGSGKHMCKGQRVATLMMKLFTAYALLTYDLATVDERGEKLQTLPAPDWNDYLTYRPRGKGFVEFTER